MYRCKITVLKTDLYFGEYAEKYAKGHTTACPRFKVGDEFLTSGVSGTGMPKGFCPDAWSSIHRHVCSLASGGKIFTLFSTHIVSCNDGIHPVFFKLEQVEDGEIPLAADCES